MYLASRITWCEYPYSLSYHTYTTTVSSSVMVDLLSNIEGDVDPMISDETNSLSKENLICSTKSPSNAYCFIIALTISFVTLVRNCKLKMAKEPFGTGTLMAFDVNFPSKAGNCSTFPYSSSS